MLSADCLRLLSFLRAIQKLFHATFQLLRTVDLKKQFRRAAEAKTLGNFVADKILGCVQAFERAFGLVVIAGDRYHHAGGTGIVGHLNRRDADQANTRIGQLAFEDGFNLLPQSFAEPFAVMFLAPALHRGHEKTV